MKWIGRISVGLFLLYFAWWGVSYAFFPTPRQALGFGFHTIEEYRYENGFLPDFSYKLKTQIDEERFHRFVRRMSLRPFEELTDEEKNHISWTTQGTWWAPSPKIDGTFGGTRLDQDTVTFAKYENGTLYYHSHAW